MTEGWRHIFSWEIEPPETTSRETPFSRIRKKWWYRVMGESRGETWRHSGTANLPDNLTTHEAVSILAYIGYFNSTELQEELKILQEHGPEEGLFFGGEVQDSLRQVGQGFAAGGEEWFGGFSTVSREASILAYEEAGHE